MATDGKTIRVVVVDDHDVVRRGLAILIRAFDDLQLIGNAANGLEAIKLADELRPDVVLMDMMMPEMGGIEATRHIRQNHPEIQVVALTSSKDEAAIQSMLEAGAVSYLSKNTAIDELVETIRGAYDGSAVVRSSSGA